MRRQETPQVTWQRPAIGRKEGRQPFRRGVQGDPPGVTPLPRITRKGIAFLGVKQQQLRLTAAAAAIIRTRLQLNPLAPIDEIQMAFEEHDKMQTRHTRALGSRIHRIDAVVGMQPQAWARMNKARPMIGQGQTSVRGQ